MRALTCGRAALVLAGFLALGCGASFDPPTEVKSLRVLGVEKDQPYALPGEDVNLSLLWYDGTPEGTTGSRRVQIQWLGGCLNPPADSYQGCFGQYAAALTDPGTAAAAGFASGSGPDFRVHLPTEAEAGARGPVIHPSTDPRLPAYGLSYVFFSVCAGELVPRLDDKNFPLRCIDETGADVGPNDFVLGYTAIYMFAPDPAGQPYRNADPVIGGFVVGEKDVTDAACFGADCLGTCDDTGCVNQFEPEDVDCATWPTLCIPSCKDDGDVRKCPANEIALGIDPSTFEPDQVTNDAYGTNYGEQMWIDYYATSGNFKSGTKLLNDATTGYNSQHFTDFYAPSSTGLVRVWVVVHDNRGGVSWAGTTLKIE
ncbi:MAG TPA: hypothetical protein VMI54_30075 [Polyangiaceae bacterium]|nr:hypothetical protein [Polyangiaceae bacterium]